MLVVKWRRPPALTVAKASKEETEWYRAQGVSADYQDRFEAAFIAYVEALADGITEATVAQAIAAQVPGPVIYALPWGVAGLAYQASFDELLGAIALEVGQAELARLPAIVQKDDLADAFTVSWDLENPYTVQWIRAHAAELVTGIGAETEESLRFLLEWGFEAGVPPRDLARFIRHVVGLNQQQAKTMKNLVQKLMSDPNISAAQRDKILAACAEKMIRYRALMIARTETINANAAGTEDSWHVAQDQGFVVSTAMKIWIASTSTRTCAICSELDGMRKPLGQPFVSSFVGEVSRPTAHPNGRCTMGLLTLSQADYDEAIAAGR